MIQWGNVPNPDEQFHYVIACTPESLAYLVTAVKRSAVTMGKEAAETALAAAEKQRGKLPAERMTAELVAAEKEAERRGPRWSAVDVLEEWATKGEAA